MNKKIQYKVNANGDVLCNGSRRPQSAGVQGDHNCCTLEFDLSEVHEQGANYFFEFVCGAGTPVIATADSEGVSFDEDNKLLSIILGDSITAEGGQTEVRIVQEVLTDEYKTTAESNTYTCFILFENKYSGLEKIKQSVYGIWAEIKSKYDKAVKACELAVESIDNKEYRLSAGDKFTSEVLNFSRVPERQRTLVTLNEDLLVTQSEYENEIKPLIDEKCTVSQALWNVYNQINYSQEKNNPIQVEESGDKSFRIILNTDTELSDTSTNPVANSTIKAELDKKVDVSEYNKKYEVIETVTTEEEISVFSRSQEPDGTAYKFERMKVLLEIASADSESSILVRMQQNANSKWVYWYQNASGISTSKKYLSCEGYKNCGIWDNETLYGGGEYLVPNKVGQVPAFWGKFSEEAVPQIGYLYIAGKLPIGTKITILGVRA